MQTKTLQFILDGVSGQATPKLVLSKSLDYVVEIKAFDASNTPVNLSDKTVKILISNAPVRGTSIATLESQVSASNECRCVFPQSLWQSVSQSTLWYSAVAVDAEGTVVLTPPTMLLLEN
jgi:hypothetical protein